MAGLAGPGGHPPGAPTGRRCTGSPRRRTARRGSGQRRSRARRRRRRTRGRSGRSWPRSRPRSAARRNVSSALALVVFGIGAGLRPGELVALRGGDVFRHGRQVMVRVSGPSARVVPVTSRYAGRAWELARGAGSGFVFRPGPAGRSIRTSSPISPGAWPPTRPRRRCRCAGPGPPSSAATWPRAPRSRCCSRSPGSPRPGRWPATPATCRASAPPRAPCGPAGARRPARERRRPDPAPRRRQCQRRDGRLRRRAHRPLRQGPGHRGRAGPPHRAAPPAAGARGAHRAAVPGPG